MHQDVICELLVKYLHDEIGAAFENIVVVVALGTHRKNTQDELKTLASEYVYNNVKVVDHDCDAQNLVNVGKTTYGTDVYVNRYAVGRKVIVISGTVHHIMAAILPAKQPRKAESHPTTTAHSSLRPKAMLLLRQTPPLPDGARDRTFHPQQWQHLCQMGA